ncbi:MAG: hypothetical protein RLZZ399_2777 [Verrucomicrobiota bacterium]|jgi:hypothetical protein
MHLSLDSLDRVLWALAAFLEDAMAPQETLVIIGGSALLALGFVSRTTRDVDILAGVDPERGLVDPRPISQTLQTAAAKVAAELRLDPDWLNTGPADQVLAGLPEGFLHRLTKREFGPFLTIYLPDRIDLIHLKLFAIVDQGLGRHSADFAALKPSDDEVLAAVRWVLTQDAGPVFPAIVLETTRAIGYGHLLAKI